MRDMDAVIQLVHSITCTVALGSLTSQHVMYIPKEVVAIYHHMVAVLNTVYVATVRSCV